MAALATVADVEAVTGRTFAAGAETNRVTRLLELASAAVRAYTGQTLSAVVGDVVPVRPDGGYHFRLPQRPVTAVASVTRGGSLLAATTYWWSRAGIVESAYGTWGVDALTVTYSHGFSPVPDDVVSVVAAIAGRAVTNPDGVRSETIGTYSVTHTVSADGAAAGLLLGTSELSVLDRYRRTVGRIPITVPPYHVPVT